MKLKFIFLFFILSMTVRAWATASMVTVKFSNNTHNNIPIEFEGEIGGTYLCNRNTSFVIPAGQQNTQYVCFSYRNNPNDSNAYVFNFHLDYDKSQIIRFSSDVYYNLRRVYNSWTTYKVVTDNGYFHAGGDPYYDSAQITIPINFESK